jgi:hypothetical protein
MARRQTLAELMGKQPASFYESNPTYESTPVPASTRKTLAEILASSNGPSSNGPQMQQQVYAQQSFAPPSYAPSEHAQQSYAPQSYGQQPSGPPSSTAQRQPLAHFVAQRATGPPVPVPTVPHEPAAIGGYSSHSLGNFATAAPAPRPSSASSAMPHRHRPNWLPGSFDPISADLTKPPTEGYVTRAQNKTLRPTSNALFGLPNHDEKLSSTHQDLQPHHPVYFAQRAPNLVSRISLFSERPLVFLTRRMDIVASPWIGSFLLGYKNFVGTPAHGAYLQSSAARSPAMEICRHGMRSEARRPQGPTRKPPTLVRGVRLC